VLSRGGAFATGADDGGAGAGVSPFSLEIWKKLLLQPFRTAAASKPVATR
jgi:hypothetical protein